MSALQLPSLNGSVETYQLRGTPLSIVRPSAPFNRIVYSAAHVVADPIRAAELSQPSAIDWIKTLEYRRYLLEQGLGIAEAMDTAQRGMGLSWERSIELIGRTMEETRDIPGALIASGCGTDHLLAHEATSCNDIIKAYAKQVEAIQKTGSRIILMASRALVKVAKSPADYERVYREVLSMCDQPVVLHWLGEAFDPELAGYWGVRTYEEAAQVCLGIISANPSKVDGIKISLLDDQKEIHLRRRLPVGVKMYTGDDFNYPSLIKGDEQGYSHALLGIFDAIAPAASQAFTALSANDLERYDHLLERTVALSRHIFRTPTQYYKTGVVFLAYLNGFQEHFFMLGGHHGMRPPAYLAEVVRLADQAGLLLNPDLAVHRAKTVMSGFGITV